MAIDLVFHFLREGPPTWVRDNFWLIAKTAATLFALFLVKVWCNGATNTSELKMHGRVVMITGGTSGIGARAVLDLAKRGAQVVLLTHAPVSDPFLVEYINDVREQTKNHMVYAEQVDLSSLHSIRQFATKWIDNAPPRRLDMLILCAATFTPAGKPRQETEEGIEQTWMVNYLANFHLLGILSPALRAQPFDRDVRVIFATCPSYIGSPPLSEPFDSKSWTTGKAYKRSKLALTTFGLAFQKHLDAYKRPDGLPMNSRVIFVDPGLSRTPGMRRWLTRGTLWGLFVYLGTYFLPWLLLKSPDQGAQSILHAVMDSNIGRGPGGKLVKECREVDFARKDVHDEAAAKQLWEESDKLIEKAEKEAAIVRARNKKQTGEKGKKDEEAEKGKKDEEAEAEAEAEKEIEALLNSIKKGQEAQKAKKGGDGQKTKGKKKAKKADS